MKYAVLLSAATLALAAPAFADDAVIMTGGAKGDYFLYFAPPVQKLLMRAWIDAPIRESKGTPDSMDFVLDHQTSYLIAQGNVYAEMAKDSKYAGKFKELTAAVGNEVVLAIVNQRTFERSKGSFTAIADHATAVRFALPPIGSGPRFTFEQLKRLDPNGLGKARNTDEFKSLDEAIEAVGRGEDDATLIVQFANPDNARFKRVNKLGLHFIGVVLSAMKALTLPSGAQAFSLCPDVDVGAKEPVSTACSPILALTGAANDNADLDKVFANVSPADFTPVESGFAAFWKKAKKSYSVGWDAAASKAEELAKKAADSM